MIERASVNWNVVRRNEHSLEHQHFSILIFSFLLSVRWCRWARKAQQHTVPAILWWGGQVKEMQFHFVRVCVCCWMTACDAFACVRMELRVASFWRQKIALYGIKFCFLFKIFTCISVGDAIKINRKNQKKESKKKMLGWSVSLGNC